MYYLILCLTIVNLVSAAVPEDLCEKCVKQEKCQLFGSLNKDDQSAWIKSFSCNEPKQNDYGTPPGFAATAKGDYVCCSDKIWGIESTNKQENVLNSWKNQSQSDNQNPKGGNKGSSYSDQKNNSNKPYSDKNNGSIVTTESTTAKNGKNITQIISPNRYPSNNWNWPNQQTNQRPDQRQYWNSRKPNYNDRNDYYNKNPRYTNTGNTNNYYNNNQRPDYETGPRRPYDYDDNNYQDTPDDYQGTPNNYQGSPNNYQGPQNGNNYGNNNNYQGVPNNNGNYPYATPNPYSRDNGQGNAGRYGQCDRVTSLPPDPQSGCCGREASDDDRITDAPNVPNAPYVPIAPIDSTPANTYYPRTWSPRQDNNAPKYPVWPWKEQENRTKRDIDYGDDIVNVEIENRISGGKETELYQYPWTVLLITIFDSGSKQTAFSCGGTLISSQFILTAGHCVYDKEATIKGVQVYLAEYDKRTFPQDCKVSPGRGKQCVENIVMYAENVIRHPQYDDKSLRNDIALIKLRGNAPYTDYIRPICLTTINVDDPKFSNLRLSVAGWGRNGPYKTNIKQSTVINLVPQTKCSRYYPDLTTRHLCAAGYTGEDTCKGDSGGPLMTLYRGKYYIVGVVSGKRADAPCGTSIPTLYTNVYHYLDWIRYNIGY